MASRVAGKIKLQSVDELLGVPEIAGTQEIEIERIHAFPNHPFKVLDDEKMDTLVDSIRENGILNPVIVRPDQSGNYEMISGHRRLHAAKIVGLKKVPAIVKEMSDDEAIIKMVDANIQREEILPSEKAFAYKMKLDALKRTAGRPTKENACHNGTHLRSDQELALQVGDSARSIQRYIRLTELIPELLDYVDNKKIGLVMAVDLSYLDEQVQKWVYEYFKENGFLKTVQVEALKNYPNLSNVTQFSVISIMNDALPKKSKESKLSFSAKKLDKYFPPQYSTKERESIIIQLLEQWSADQVQSEYAELIRDNIDLDILLERYPFDKELLNGIFDLILETVLCRNNEIVVASNKYPAELVRSKFLKLTSSHIEYAMGCMKSNTTKVHNIKKYLLATLFNAPSTISGYYQAEVNHDYPQFAVSGK